MPTDHPEDHLSDSRASHTFGTDLSVRVGADTHVGRVREENQDRISRFSSPVGEVFLVVDGMGGHLGGGTAAQMVVEGLERALRDAPVHQAPEQALQDAASRTHDSVRRRASSGDESLGKMGATAVLALIRGRRVRIAHAGDSRAYLLRDGELRRLTRDHTLVQRMLDDDLLSEEEARDHPDASVVSRAFGRSDDLEFEISAPFEIASGDRLLLCSDGLCGYVDDPAIAREMAHGGAQQTTDRLIELALEAGGEDNISIQLVIFSEASGRHAAPVAPAMPAALATTSSPERRRRRGLLFPLTLIALVLALLALGALVSKVWLLPWFHQWQEDRRAQVEEPADVEAGESNETLPPAQGPEAPPNPNGLSRENDSDDSIDRNIQPWFELTMPQWNGRLSIYAPDAMPLTDEPGSVRLEKGVIHYPMDLEQPAEDLAELLDLEMRLIRSEDRLRGVSFDHQILLLVLPDGPETVDWAQAQIYYGPGLSTEALRVQKRLREQNSPPKDTDGDQATELTSPPGDDFPGPAPRTLRSARGFDRDDRLLVITPEETDPDE